MPRGVETVLGKTHREFRTLDPCLYVQNATTLRAPVDPKPHQADRVLASRCAVMRVHVEAYTVTSTSPT